MPPAPLPETARKNVEAIAQVEQRLHGRRTRVEKIGDGIARYFGSLWFVAAHVVAIAGWVAWNVRAVAGVEPFDPHPFPLLGLIVGVEFIFLTTFVLMDQNLQSRRQEKWGHLTLQVALLTEQEVTKNMQMLHLICRHLGLEQPVTDAEATDLAQATPLTALVGEIDKARDAGDRADEAGKPEPRAEPT